MILIDTYQVTACLAGASLLLAIASPIISTGLNIWHQQKMKRIELNYLHQTQVIEKYLTAVSGLINYTNGETQKEYGLACGEIYSAVPEQFWPLLDEIDASIQADNIPHTNETFRTLCKKLAASYNLRGKI